MSELNTVLLRLGVSDVEASPIIDRISKELFSLKITPYMLYALHRGLAQHLPGSWEAFRASFIPSAAEAARVDLEHDGLDGIGEEHRDVNPVNAITNFYGNRVLFRVTKMCPGHCRYCFRRRMVSDADGSWDEHGIHEGLQYIAGNPEINEVILSGGDPLVLGDSRIEFLLASLRRISHIRRVRIDTKALTMVPQRVTQGLLSILRTYKPVYVIGHFSHVYELETSTREACERLVDNGVPVLAHTPLLRGVNDDVDQLSALMEALVDCRVRPYYLIQFIPTKWTEHFRVPLERGLSLLEGLQKRLGGLAWPTYIVYLPEACGKVPLSPQYVLRRTHSGYVFRSLNGREIVYEEPAAPQTSLSKEA